MAQAQGRRRWGLALWVRLILIPASVLPVLLMIFGHERPSDLRVVRPAGPRIIYAEPLVAPDPPPPDFDFGHVEPKAWRVRLPPLPEIQVAPEGGPADG